MVGLRSVPLLTPPFPPGDDHERSIGWARANATRPAATWSANRKALSIDESWAGTGRDDPSFLQSGCAEFELRQPDGTWVSLATMCDQPVVLEPGWRLTLDPPMDATAARYSQDGHGWFVVGDLRAMGVGP